MQSFQTLTSCIIPLLTRDVDTDQIIPARYLKVTDKNGLAEGLFYGWRYRADGSPDPEFPLNMKKYQGCQILLAEDNFGCGSSREHAPWALLGWGIRAIISTSFADIFRNNALKNGLLPVIVDAAAHEHITGLVESGDQVTATINLAEQTVQLADGYQSGFPIDPFSKTCLLEGVDSLGYLLKHESQIAAYESQFAAG
jgi:3-isopropylmalate/(R)-2-methylmalate dehydratase small subunit